MSDLRIDYSDLSATLEEGRREHQRREEAGGWPGRLAARALSWVAGGFVVAALPFVVLIRGGVTAHRAWGLGAWGALLAASAATGLLLWFYAWLASRWLGTGQSVGRLMRRAAVGVGAAYVLYTLVYVAGANVKGAEVRAEYRSLHPLLRVAASAVFLVDGEAVITDAGRTPEDYWLMGLPLNEASLHFPQADGWVRALDLRTVGRSELRNRALELGFWALGFHSLRHVGTADHLHVSLRPPGA